MDAFHSAPFPYDCEGKLEHKLLLQSLLLLFLFLPGRLVSPLSWQLQGRTMPRQRQSCR